MRNIFISIFLFLLINSFAQSTFTLSPAICEQSSVAVTANNGTISVVGYTWTANPAGPVFASPNNSTTSIVFPLSGAFTINLATTNGTNTGNYTNTITVNSLPSITISINTPTPICPPPTNIGGLNLSASGANLYTWTPGAYTGANVNIFPQPSGSITYTVSGSDVNGCIGEASEFVQVYPIPTVFATANTPVCAGNMVCLNASGSLQIWYWSGPCGYTSGNQSDCFLANAGCGGIYTIGGSDNNFCVNEATVSVNIVSQPTINVSSTSSVLCIGQSATLTANGASSYTWLPGGPGNSIVISPSVNATYTVSGSSVNCSNITVFTQSVATCTGFNQNFEFGGSVKVTPNPAFNEIKIHAPATENCDVEIQDVTGKVQKALSVSFNTAINIDDLPQGLYFIKIKLTGYYEILKLVKQE